MKKKNKKWNDYSMNFLTFVDHNDYIKKENALAHYFKKAYKYLIFEVMPKLKQKGKIDGIYEIELPTEPLFEKVYGKLKLKFSVKNDVATIEDIEPGQILIECYMRQLPLYHGIPYTNKKDLFKLKMMEANSEQK